MWAVQAWLNVVGTTVAPGEVGGVELRIGDAADRLKAFVSVKNMVARGLSERRRRG